MRILNVSILYILITLIQSYAGELDPLLEGRQSMNSAAVKALGDATIANPDDILCGIHNPALVYSYFMMHPTKKFSAAAGYGRDSLFDKHIIPSGIAYGNREGAIGGFYRGLFKENGKMQNEAVLNLSGMLTAPVLDENGYATMGQVNLGLNIRYVWYTWNSRIMIPQDTALKSIDNASIHQNQLALDIGLFQADVSPNLDFALAMKNLLGYEWRLENPVIGDSLRKTISLSGDTLIDTVSYYQRTDSKSQGWIKNEYRALTIGIVYHINKNSSSWQLQLPIDLEIIGMFNKKIKNQYSFRGGIAATIKDHFALRFGYSRTPGPIQSGWNEIKKMNVFTGGAGITIDPISIDFFLSDDTFGTTLILDL